MYISELDKRLTYWQEQEKYTHNITHIHKHVECTVAEEYNGLQARCSKLPRENFNCDYNVQLSTAIQLFNSDSLFLLPKLNCHSQCSTVILTFNRDSTFHRSTMIATSNRDSTFQVQLQFQLSPTSWFFNTQPGFNFSNAICIFQWPTVIPTAVYK